MTRALKRARSRLGRPSWIASLTITMLMILPGLADLSASLTVDMRYLPWSQGGLSGSITLDLIQVEGQIPVLVTIEASLLDSDVPVSLDSVTIGTIKAGTVSHLILLLTEDQQLSFTTDCFVSVNIDELTEGNPVLISPAHVFGMLSLEKYSKYFVSMNIYGTGDRMLKLYTPDEMDYQLGNSQSLMMWDRIQDSQVEFALPVGASNLVLISDTPASFMVDLVDSADIDPPLDFSSCDFSVHATSGSDPTKVSSVDLTTSWITNLFITDFSYYPSDIGINQPVYLSARFRFGGAKPGTVAGRVLVDNAPTGPDLTIDIEEHDGGWWGDVNDIWTPATLGPHTISIIVDPDDTIPESQENDNLFTTVLMVTSNQHVPPVANIGPVQNVKTNEVAYFNALGSYHPDPTRTITDYDWDFGDGHTGTGLFTEHTFSTKGSYEISLKVTDDIMLPSSIATTQIMILNTPPIASAGQDMIVAEDSEVLFDGGGSLDPDGEITDYDWLFGDMQSGSGMQVTHTYNSPGNYNVQLTVEDNDGATTVDSIVVNVVPDPPLISADSDDCELSPGRSTVLSVAFGNPSPYDDYYSIGLSGISSDWYEIPCGVFVEGNSEERVGLAISIPSDISLKNNTQYNMSIWGYTSNLSINNSRTIPLIIHSTYESSLRYAIQEVSSLLGESQGQDMHNLNISLIVLNIALDDLDDNCKLESFKNTRKAADKLDKTDDAGYIVDCLVAAIQKDVFEGLEIAAVQSWADPGMISSGWSYYNSSFNYCSPDNHDAAIDDLLKSYKYAIDAIDGIPIAAQDPLGTMNSRTITVNGKDSLDLDGTISSFYWTFGDGHNGSGIFASHTYDEDGDYSVELTICDDDGNENTNAVCISIDTTPPSLGSLNLQSEQILAGDNLVLDIEASDVHGVKMILAEIRKPGTDRNQRFELESNGSGAYHCTIGTFDLFGSYYIDITACDSLGNSEKVLAAGKFAVTYMVEAEFIEDVEFDAIATEICWLYLEGARAGVEFVMDCDLSSRFLATSHLATPVLEIPACHFDRYVEFSMNKNIAEMLLCPEIELFYDEAEFPSGVDESMLFIYYWNKTTWDWEPLPDCNIDIDDNYVSAKVPRLDSIFNLGYTDPTNDMVYIEETDVTTIPEQPHVGQPTEITAVVHATDHGMVSGVPVNFYEYVDEEWVSIAPTQYIDIIPALGSEVVRIMWIPDSAGGHQLKVSVDYWQDPVQDNNVVVVVLDIEEYGVLLWCESQSCQFISPGQQGLFALKVQNMGSLEDTVYLDTEGVLEPWRAVYPQEGIELEPLEIVTIALKIYPDSDGDGINDWDEMTGNFLHTRLKIDGTIEKVGGVFTSVSFPFSVSDSCQYHVKVVGKATNADSPMDIEDMIDGVIRSQPSQTVVPTTLSYSYEAIWEEGIEYFILTLDYAVELSGGSYSLDISAVQTLFDDELQIHFYMLEITKFAINALSRDTDSDGLTDHFEADIGLSPCNQDTDKDNIWDAAEMQYWGIACSLDEASAAERALDTDFDNDGLKDGDEIDIRKRGTDPADSDTDDDDLVDGVEVTILTDPHRPDTDNDGMPDGWEMAFTLNPLANDAQQDKEPDGLVNILEFINNADPTKQDTDSDALNDLPEVQIHGTLAWNPDTDSDGMPDGWEVLYLLNPLNPNDPGLNPDQDGLTNLAEYQVGTNPNNHDTDGDTLWDGDELGLVDLDGHTNLYITDPSKADTDGDGLSDGVEIATNPTLADTDEDGLWDLDETNPAVDFDGIPNLAGFITDPTEPDTDSDEIVDGWELYHLFNPTNSADAALDAEPDGLTNLEEFQKDTNPRDPDSDGDLVFEGQEDLAGTNPAATDTDNDGLWDGHAVQKDGFWHIGELDYGTDPLEPDSDDDGLTDYQEISDYYKLDRVEIEDYYINPTGSPENYQTGVHLKGYQNPGIATDKVNLAVSLPSSCNYKINIDGTGILKIFAGDIGEQDMVNEKTTEVIKNGLILKIVLIENSQEVAQGNVVRDVQSIRAQGEELEKHWYYESTFSTGVAQNPVYDISLTVDTSRIRNPPFTQGTIEYLELLADYLTIDRLGLDPLDDDCDDDDLLDGFEIQAGTYPWSSDPDEDGLSDKNELEQQTNPEYRDTDYDGVRDAVELGQCGQNPDIYTQYDINPSISSSYERIAKGVHNHQQYNPGMLINNWDFDLGAVTTDPLNPDSDSDGAPDGAVDGWGYDLQTDRYGMSGSMDFQIGSCDGEDLDLNGAIEGDSDGDGLWEPDEPDSEVWLETSPDCEDNDEDDMPDGWEKAYSLNPLDPSDAGSDLDGDLGNLFEYIARTNPSDETDTDGDGLSDSAETLNTVIFRTNVENGAFSCSKYGGSGSWMWFHFSFSGKGDHKFSAAAGLGMDPSGITGITFFARLEDGSEIWLKNDGSKAYVFPLYSWETGGLYYIYENPVDEAQNTYMAVSDRNKIMFYSDPRNPDTDLDHIPDGKETSSDVNDDGDTFKSFRDQDSDDDGLLDNLEDRDLDGIFDPGSRETNPIYADTDGDGTGDEDDIWTTGDRRKALDYDNDGLTGFPAHNGLGAFGGLEDKYGTTKTVQDTDGDGLWDGDELFPLLWKLDTVETAYKTNPTLTDTDGDGLWDGYDVTIGQNTYHGELTLKTIKVKLQGGTTTYQVKSNPTLADSDFDGFYDGKNIVIGGITHKGEQDVQSNVYGTSGTDPNKMDTDIDGYTDKDEVDVGDLDEADPLDYAINPDTTSDTDGDGMPNGWEDAKGLNKLNPSDAALDKDSDGFDADGDGSISVEERFSNLEEYLAGTNPSNANSDTDNMKDGWEVFYGLDPLDEDDAAFDDDSDGLTNIGEYTNGADPTKPDTDGDGINDGQEVSGGTKVNNWDSDGDLISDSIDPEPNSYHVFLGSGEPSTPLAKASIKVEDSLGKDIEIASASVHYTGGGKPKPGYSIHIEEKTENDFPALDISKTLQTNHFYIKAWLTGMQEPYFVTIKIRYDTIDSNSEELTKTWIKTEHRRTESTKYLALYFWNSITDEWTRMPHTEVDMKNKLVWGKAITSSEFNYLIIGIGYSDVHDSDLDYTKDAYERSFGVDFFEAESLELMGSRLASDNAPDAGDSPIVAYDKGCIVHYNPEFPNAYEKYFSFSWWVEPGEFKYLVRARSDNPSCIICLSVVIERPGLKTLRYWGEDLPLSRNYQWKLFGPFTVASEGYIRLKASSDTACIDKILLIKTPAASADPSSVWEIESMTLSDPLSKDTDGDGLSDYEEINDYKIIGYGDIDKDKLGDGPLDEDTDGDDAEDGIDLNPIVDLQLRLTINELQVLDRVDSSDSGDRADAYLRIKIGEEEFWVPDSSSTSTQNPLDNKDCRCLARNNNVINSGSTYYNLVFVADVPDVGQTVSIEMELFDDDYGGTPAKDDRLDVSPRYSGDVDWNPSNSDIGRVCKLVYDMNLGKWTGDDYIWDDNQYGHVSGEEDGITSGNQGDSEIWFSIRTNDNDDDDLSFQYELGLGSSPWKWDTDSDGCPDGWEKLNNLDFLNTDARTHNSDSDSLSDWREYIEHTNPNDEDTDGDGMNDGWEVNNGLDPTIPDDANDDPDFDDVPNSVEAQHNTNPNNPNSDGDGLNDGFEIQYWDHVSLTLNPNNPDSDGDSIQDEDEDYDGDGLTNLVEFQFMGHPLIRDVFVEVDWMQYDEVEYVDRAGIPHMKTVSCRMSDAARDAVIASYARHSIRLHIDNGNVGGGNLVNFQQGTKIDIIDGDDNDNLDIKWGNGWDTDSDGIIWDDPGEMGFGDFAATRFRVFHYCIFAYRCLCDQGGHAQDYIWGCHMGIASYYDNDFMVAYSHNRIKDNTLAQAGVFMHELGHNFELNRDSNGFYGIDVFGPYTCMNYRDILYYIDYTSDEWNTVGNNIDNIATAVY